MFSNINHKDNLFLFKSRDLFGNASFDLMTFSIKLIKWRIIIAIDTNYFNIEQVSVQNINLFFCKLVMINFRFQFLKILH